MDIDARIKRRKRGNGERRLVQEYESLSPVAHVGEPVHRGPVLEQILDHLDPVFDGKLPPNAYVHGPRGSGKSAVVTALFARLRRLSTGTGAVIHTSTRAATPTSPGFVCVDSRATTSEFRFYHGVLDGLVDEPVPEHGISTSDLRERLHGLLDGSHPGVVVAVDHVGELGSAGVDELVDLFAGLPSNVSWLAVGRTEPGRTDLTDYTARTIEFDRYRRQTVVDILTTRASSGLSRGALDHETARRIADWADGNAHDALAVLFTASSLAERADADRLSESHVEAAIDEMPSPSVSLGRVLSLPRNRQIALRKLVDLGPSSRESVTATTEAISSDEDVDLSAGTVKRFLYEMAEIGVVERVQSDEKNGRGRPPSRVELRFPPTAFRELYDLRQTER